MKKSVVFDFSRVILFPKDALYRGKLNPLNKKLKDDPKKYSFFDHFFLNQDTLNLVVSLRKKGYKTYIFTSGTVQNEQEVREVIDPLFDKIVSAYDFNLSKSDPAAYRTLLTTIGMKAHDVLFIDDSPANIHAAETVGIQALLFTSVEDIQKKIDIKLSKSSIV